MQEDDDGQGAGYREQVSGTSFRYIGYNICLLLFLLWLVIKSQLENEEERRVVNLINFSLILNGMLLTRCNNKRNPFFFFFFFF